MMRIFPEYNAYGYRRLFMVHLYNPTHLQHYYGETGLHICTIYVIRPMKMQKKTVYIASGQLPLVFPDQQNKYKYIKISNIDEKSSC